MSGLQILHYLPSGLQFVSSPSLLPLIFLLDIVPVRGRERDSIIVLEVLNAYGAL